jgi:membrane-bound serine protease (ClpP class)
VLSLATFFMITPKVVRAQRNEDVRTGWEDLIGELAEVRSPLDPAGDVWVGGALWKAHIAEGAESIEVGSKVRIDSVDGLTLVVSPTGRMQTVEQGSQ